ncbi:MAG: BatD family protein [Methylococcaceae bacterium]
MRISEAIAVCVCVALLSGGACAADIQVSSDRNPVRQDEAFTLTYTALQTPDADPDFSPLERDFDILAQSQNQHISLTNGHYQEVTRYELSLIPKQAGTYAIPPLAFGTDKSKGLTITVLGAPATAPQDDEDVFLDVSADPTEPMVQAQSLYTLKIFSRSGFSGGELSDPVADNVLMQRLGQDNRYTTLRQGTRYEVVERRYALFPQKSGALTINGVTLTTRVPVRQGGGKFDPFFGARMQIKRLHGDALALNAQPIPETYGLHPWLPAQQVALQESWSGPLDGLTPGEPVTRTLTLTAQGVTIGLLPELVPAETAADPKRSIHQYPDQPLLNEEKLNSGVVSVRHEKIAYVPTGPGSLQVPELNVYWWNTQTQRREVAHLPAHTLNVLAGTRLSPTLEPPVMVSKDDAPPIVRSEASPLLWVGLAAAFAAIGVLALVIGWGIMHRAGQSPTRQADQPKPRSSRYALAALRSACLANDAKAAHKALIAWASSLRPEISVTELKIMAAKTNPPLNQELEHLDRALYGGTSPREWNGQHLWRAIKTSDPLTATKTNTPTKTRLEPLYPEYQ